MVTLEKLTVAFLAASLDLAWNVFLPIFKTMRLPYYRNSIPAISETLLLVEVC